MSSQWPPYFTNPMGEETTAWEDAKALQEAAGHVELAGLAGAASLMRRCASRLYRVDEQDGDPGER